MIWPRTLVGLDIGLNWPGYKGIEKKKILGTSDYQVSSQRTLSDGQAS